MLRYLFVAVCLSSFGLLQAQNLVKNGSFEELDGKIKELGNIQVAIGWTAANGAGADLFSPEAKMEEAKTPSNKYGKEKPYRGNNYAGIKAYSYKGKENRSYITGTLSSKLKEGEKYCVTFYQSLSEDSKYAIADVAGVFGAEPFEMGEMGYNILMDPSVALNKPAVVTRQLYWDDICNVYTANGDEAYFTIGNFVSDAQVEYKKMKRPSDFSGQQMNYAYYYIDNVEVRLLKEGEKCDCEKEVFVDTPKIVRSTVESNVSDEDVKKTIQQLRINFEEKSAKLDPNQEGIEEILKHLKLNSGLRLQIQGRISIEEVKAGIKDPRIKTLAEARAKAVQAYLVEQKIEKGRLTFLSLGSDRPLGTPADVDFNAKNQSVTFRVTGN